MSPGWGDRATTTAGLWGGSAAAGSLGGRAGGGRRSGVVRWAVVALAVLAGVVALRQATMNRPDPPRPERSTTVDLLVRTNGSRLAAKDAAMGLWAACSSAVDEHRLVEVEALDDSHFALHLEPALGDHAQRRLVGCLEDATVPRILGDVARVEHR